MQRVMTETVKDASGAVRWQQGQVVDYPSGTWAAIAGSLGRALDDFTAEPGLPGETKRKPGRPRKEVSDVADAA